MIYLDNNATTQPSEAVVLAVSEALRETWANPSSVHRLGQTARAKLELARRQVADLVGARPRELVFTGGGTEAIDLALRGSLAALGSGAALITSKVEHAAVRELAEELEKSGRRVIWLAIDSAGIISPASVQAALAGIGPAVVSVQWANNETGALQPVHEIARVCSHAGAVFHCDATQWVGKRPTWLDADVIPPSSGGVKEPLGASLVTFSAHKFHGPKGVGVLWSRRGVKLRPTLVGTQELGRRGGTENVSGIIGAGTAAEEARVWLEDASPSQAVGRLRDEFERGVLAGAPGAVVNGLTGAGRLWNTTNIGFPRLEAEALLLYLSERGVCASAGAACSSGSLDPSPVLLAMGVAPEVAHGSLRFSLSKHTTEREIKEAAAIVIEAVAVLGRTLPR